MASFIFSNQNSNGTESLYATDGTAAGTTDLQVSRFGFAGNNQPDFVNLAGNVLFVGSGNVFGGNGQEVYRTDGTAVGTSEAPIAGLGGSLTPTGLWKVGNTVLTSGLTTAGSQGVFASADGVNFNEIAYGVGVGTSGVAVSNGVGFFGGIDGAGNSQGLWRTDGTAAGTTNITPTGVTLDPLSFVTVGTKTVFTSGDGPFSGGAHLWTTDGATAGTMQLQVPSLGEPYGINSLTSIGTKALFLTFSSPDASNYSILWSTDGTVNGTVQISAGSFSGGTTLLSLGDKAALSDGTNLYLTDGTVTGTMALATPTTAIGSVVALGRDLVYVGTGTSRTAAGTDSLFSYDSSTGATTQITLPSVNLDGATLSVAGKQVVFSAVDPSGAKAFFDTDGTQAGTKELALPPGVVLDPTNPPFIAGLPAGVTPPPPPTPPVGVVTLPGGAQNYMATAGQTILAGPGSDTITAAAGQVTVVAGSGSLAFIGGTGASSVTGGAGSSTIFGGAGGGYYTGGRAGFNVLVSEGAGGANTTLTGAGGGDQVFGSASGNDNLIAGSGRDSILGGGGHTTIQGGATGSVIFTGGGTSVVFGGTGGGDTVVGGAGSLNVNAQGGDAIFGAAGALNVTGSKSGADSIVGGAGPLSVNGQGANMLVVAGITTSNIQVGGGASLIFAGSGAASVLGGAGSLQVVLGSGAATITEGSGVASYDVVDGAAGGQIVLNGFKPGADKINLFSYTPAQRQITSSGGSSLLSLADGTKITIAGVANLAGSIVG